MINWPPCNWVCGKAAHRGGSTCGSKTHHFMATEQKKRRVGPGAYNLPQGYAPVTKRPFPRPHLLKCLLFPSNTKPLPHGSVGGHLSSQIPQTPLRYLLPWLPFTVCSWFPAYCLAWSSNRKISLGKNKVILTSFGLYMRMAFLRTFLCWQFICHLRIVVLMAILN